MVGKLAKETYKKHKNDAQSVQMWVIENKDKVFFYQKSGLQVHGGLQGSNMPFTIGIQTDWQREMMLRCGHMKMVCLLMPFLKQMRRRYVTMAGY
jgi:hypothetical protein